MNDHQIMASREERHHAMDMSMGGIGWGSFALGSQGGAPDAEVPLATENTPMDAIDELCPDVVRVGSLSGQFFTRRPGNSGGLERQNLFPDPTDTVVAGITKDGRLVFVAPAPDGRPLTEQGLLDALSPMDRRLLAERWMDLSPRPIGGMAHAE